MVPCEGPFWFDLFFRKEKNQFGLDLQCTRFSGKTPHISTEMSDSESNDDVEVDDGGSDDGGENMMPPPVLPPKSVSSDSDSEAEAGDEEDDEEESDGEIIEIGDGDGDENEEDGEEMEDDDNEDEKREKAKRAAHDVRFRYSIAINALCWKIGKGIDKIIPDEGKKKPMVATDPSKTKVPFKNMMTRNDMYMAMRKSIKMTQGGEGYDLEDITEDILRMFNMGMAMIRKTVDNWKRPMTWGEGREMVKEVVLEMVRDKKGTIKSINKYTNFHMRLMAYEAGEV